MKNLKAFITKKNLDKVHPSENNEIWYVGKPSGKFLIKLVHDYWNKVRYANKIDTAFLVLTEEDIKDIIKRYDPSSLVFRIYETEPRLKYIKLVGTIENADQWPYKGFYDITYKFLKH